jgi:cold shock CspA family protein
MSQDPVSIRSGAKIQDALEAFTSESVSALPVLDDAERPVGILSYLDVLLWLRERALGSPGREAPFKPHARVTRLHREEGFGYLETADGREMYFERQSVPGAAFERLSIGTEVRFVEEPGEAGPQAGSVEPVH